MTFIWTVKNANGEVIPHFTSASALEVARKVVPAHYDAFRLPVSSSYRELFDRALKQILEHEDWRIVRLRGPRRSRQPRRPPPPIEPRKVGHEAYTCEAGLERSAKRADGQPVERNQSACWLGFGATTAPDFQ